jgi:hypothetical protein
METLTAVAAPRYRLGRSVGHGGLGEVFEAWDEQLQRRVALKRLSAVGADGLTAYQAAQHEATHLAALQHPNIVSVHDFGADEAGPFLIMELVDGETLEAVVARGPFPFGEFCLLARQALEGLAAAHQADLLHRDLKPGNLMLKRGPTGLLQVKILDFGLSKHPFDAEPRTLTATGADTVLGTVEYLPPEVFERLPFDQRSDLYALGCLFYYALAGICPFRGATIGEVIASHLQGRVASLATVRRDLPPALCDWVMRLISREPERRPASAREAVQEFDHMMEPLLGASSWRQQWFLALAGGVGLAALLIGLGAGVFLERWNHAPRLASAPAAPQPEVLPLSAPAKVYRADDLANLRPQAERAVMVEGRIVALRRNPQLGVYYLNFSVDYTQAVSLVFFQDALPEGMTAEKLEDCVNKTVRVSGRLKEYRGALQIIVQRAGQIEVQS